MSCNCANLPCQCSPVLDPSAGCPDPGPTDVGQVGATIVGNCLKRLLTWRGADDDGTPVDDVNVAPQKAFRVQGEDGADRWKNPPCIEFPVLRLTTDGNGYGTNGADSLQARGGQCEADLKGPVDHEAFLMWDPVSGLWKASPGIPIVPPCTRTAADVFLTSGVTAYVVLFTGPTGSWAVGGTFTLRGIEFEVTDIGYANGADDYAEGVTTVITATRISALSLSPWQIAAGSCANYRGIKPLQLCLLDDVVAVEGKTLFDSIIVCKDGEMLKVPAREGFSLVGNANGKWEMAKGMMHLITAAGVHTLDNMWDSTDITVDLTTVLDYNSTWTNVYVLITINIATTSGNYWLTFEPIPNFEVSSQDGNDNNSLTIWMPIPNDKILRFRREITTDAPSSDPKTNSSSVHILGWS